MEAQGQVNEKAIKVEKFYDPKFEVYVRMPTFILDTEKYIEAEVSGFYPYEKTVKGDVHLRWFAKKVDYTTPLYNDSILYRQEYSYYHNISNTYRSNLYNARDGIPVRNISLISQPSRYGYFDPYVVSKIFFIYLLNYQVTLQCLMPAYYFQIFFSKFSFGKYFQFLVQR